MWPLRLNETPTILSLMFRISSKLLPRRAKLGQVSQVTVFLEHIQKQTKKTKHWIPLEVLIGRGNDCYLHLARHFAKL